MDDIQILNTFIINISQGNLSACKQILDNEPTIDTSADTEYAILF